MSKYLTPDRSVEVVLDHSEEVQIEPFFAIRRDKTEIKPDTISDVEQLQSGIWILRPRESHFSLLHETTTGQGSIVRLSATEHPPWLEEIPVQRTFPELPWLTSPAAGISTSGDHLMIKRIPASATEAVGITTAIIHPTLPVTPSYPMRPVAQFKNDATSGIDPENQGYVIRWLTPVHNQEPISNVCSFTFGGEITGGGYGLFTVCFTGDGEAFLKEWVDGAWVLVDQWRYCPAHAAMLTGHVVRIIPHVSFIEFKSDLNEPSFPRVMVDAHWNDPYHGLNISTNAHTYEIKNRAHLGSGPGGLARPITGAGHPLFWVREDLLLRFQWARITYPATGYLIDAPFTIPSSPTGARAIEIARFGQVWQDTLTHVFYGTITAEPYNARTGVALSTQSEAYTFNGGSYSFSGWTMPEITTPSGQVNAVKVKITLANTSGAGFYLSPWFFGYEVRNRGVNTTPTVSPLAINATHYRQSPVVRRISITGQDADPSHASASFRVSDFVDRCGRLGVRGQMPIRITTTYDPADQSKKSILFEGYLYRSDGRLRGRSGRAWPSPNWHDYDVSCVGKWRRLAEREYLTKQLLSFTADLNPLEPPVEGKPKPWKVTDAIRWLLMCAGFPETQIDVADYSIRFEPTTPENADLLKIVINANIAEVVARLCRDFFNAVLLWDANAGTAGKWRMKRIPIGTETPLWSFVLAPPVTGRLVHVMGAYGANTCAVHRDTLSEWTVPPEGNFLRMSGVLKNSKLLFHIDLQNPYSWDRDGGTRANPNTAEWIGRFRPIYGRASPLFNTYGQVAFAARRVFDLLCRPQRFARFTAPLVLVDPGEPAQYPVYLRRPLQFGDVVRFNGLPYMVRGCTIDIRKQHHMLAEYEIQRFNDPLPYA